MKSNSQIKHGIGFNCCPRIEQNKRIKGTASNRSLCHYIFIDKENQSLRMMVKPLPNIYRAMNNNIANEKLSGSSPFS